jgi:CHAT domain-containing protein
LDLSVYLIKMADSYTRCPEPEVLAAYVDRGLGSAERARVDHHLASCPQCIALLAGVARTVADVLESTPHAEPAVELAPRAATRRTLVGVLAAAAAVITILSASSLLRPWLERDTGLVNLVGVSEQRSVLGRLAGGFPHAPLVLPTAGGQVGRAAETDRILLAAGKIRESFGERETPTRLHELGVSQLISGRYDEAASSLLAASRQQPANARYLNDVAAVRLERARLGLRPDDLPRALAAADRAVRLDPTLREAWFNRALAMTALALDDQAKAAWSDYLRRDSSSEWATEARTRQAALAAPNVTTEWLQLEPQLSGPVDAALAERAVRLQMTEVRNFVEFQLLPAWSAAVESGGNGATERERIRELSAALMRLGGDALYLDAVKAIDNAEARGTAALKNLAIAHRHYSEAAAIFLQDRYGDAAPLLAVAETELGKASSPFVHRAALDSSAAAYFRGRADEAVRRLGPLQTAADAGGYANILARISWQRGLIAIGQSRLGDAQAHYEETLAVFARMGDAEQAAFAHNLLANLHFYLGDRNSEWHHRLLAFEGLKVSRSHRVRHAILGTTAASLRVDDPGTALTMQDAVLSNARAWGRDAAIAEALSQRAATLFEMGRIAAAEQDLALARDTLARVPDPQFRSRLEVTLLSTESDVLRQRSPAAAVAAATRAIAIVEQRRDRLRLAQLNLRLANANVVWGNLVAAEAALDRGITAFEEERAGLSDEGRISALDESWRLFDAAVHLATKKGDYPRAFALTERARMRSLAESRSASAGLSLQQVQDGLADGEAVLSLSQFDDDLSVWVIRRSGTVVTTRPITRRDAELLVARQQDEIRFEAVEPAASAELYNQIIRPVAAQLSGINRLVIVADATFGEASFAGLWDRSSRRFLVEDRQISSSPSAAAFVAANRLEPPASTHALILAGPGERAETGARAVAAAYEAPQLLTGSAATRSRFLSAELDRGIMHISARTIENRAYPLLSRVVLADEPDRRHSGALMGHDIASRTMSQTALVVLDGDRASGQGGGAPSLTRAFLTAGVPAVLAPLPGTDEAATRELMVGFHRLMSSGIAADEALNRLQRNVLQSNGRRLGAWSALVLYGSDR